MSGICSLFPPFGDPWPSCLLPSQTFVSKVMSLLFNTLSRFIIALLPRSKQASFNLMTAVTICSDFGAQENKVCHCFHYFFIYLHEVMVLDAMILVFGMSSFKPTFPLSSFTFIKRLFSSPSLSAIRVVSSVCLRILIFLPAVLISACASASQTFHMV